MTGPLPDGSGFCTASFPLPKDHWIYGETGKPPAPLRMGTDASLRKPLEELVRDVARYAIKASTMNGKEMDFDPEAMIQNLVVGLLGYRTKDGRSQPYPTSGLR